MSKACTCWSPYSMLHRVELIKRRSNSFDRKDLHFICQGSGMPARRKPVKAKAEKSGLGGIPSIETCSLRLCRKECEEDWERMLPRQIHSNRHWRSTYVEAGLDGCRPGYPRPYRLAKWACAHRINYSMYVHGLVFSISYGTADSSGAFSPRPDSPCSQYRNCQQRPRAVTRK